jgi:hypothetical protein
MARTRTRSPMPAPASDRRPTGVAPPVWADWLAEVQAFQVRAMRDLLGVNVRYASALGAARDPQAVLAANKGFASDCQACVDDLRDRWQELAKAVPPDAMAALGWRLRPGLAGAAASRRHDGANFLVERSRLGLEALLRPWMPASDLDHTGDFVA